MLTKDHSQAGQTLWVLDTLKGLHGGKFLDVGANDPVVISNTFALEDQCGWKGFLLDNDPNCIRDLREQRLSTVIECDSTKFDYASLPVRDFDYLSLDVDSATLDSLKKLLADGVTFRTATVEHDSYRFGNGPRDEIRALLQNAGYSMVLANVCNPYSPGLPYEDWWVDPKRV